MKHRTIAYLYAFTLIVFGVGLSFLASTTTRADELNMGLIIYWYILPGLPFVCLGLFGAFRANQFSLRPFVGATIGALVAVSVPYG